MPKRPLPDGDWRSNARLEKLSSCLVLVLAFCVLLFAVLHYLVG